MAAKTRFQKEETLSGTRRGEVIQANTPRSNVWRSEVRVTRVSSRTGRGRAWWRPTQQTARSQNKPVFPSSCFLVSRCCRYSSSPALAHFHTHASPFIFVPNAFKKTIFLNLLGALMSQGENTAKSCCCSAYRISRPQRRWNNQHFLLESENTAAQ